MNVILSTRNPSKAEQIKAIFAGSTITVMTLDEAGIKGQGIENGTTLKENAIKKALFVHGVNPKYWVMADDTGIFIDALDGAPGVDTANWHGGSNDAETMMCWVLKQLENISNRRATFKTVVAAISPTGEQYFFTGEVCGKILKTPRVSPQSSMPYSAIFVPDGSDKTWAEMTVAEENAISHRGQAFRKARAFLE